jgi:murein DD-endopeptidase MepM/ murein hydrolase activator NlpD
MRVRAVVPAGVAVVTVLVGAGALYATGGRRVPVAPVAATRAADRPAPTEVAPAATTGRDADRHDAGAVDTLRRIAGVEPPLRPRPLTDRELLVPVRGVKGEDLSRGFDQARGLRTHEALDIMAAAGTPVVAVDHGSIAKLFNSKSGGITVYQFDLEREYAYYYAHLDHYAPGLAEGQEVERGQVLGFVGTTGNAPKDAPHLHFAIFRLGPEQRWWEGTAIDPYPLLKEAPAEN